MLSLWLGRAQAQMGQDARALTWLRPPFPVRVCFPQVHGSALLFFDLDSELGQLPLSRRATCPSSRPCRGWPSTRTPRSSARRAYTRRTHSPSRVTSSALSSYTVAIRRILDYLGLSPPEKPPLCESKAQLTAEASALGRLNEASIRLWQSPDLRAGLEEMLDAAIALLGADMGNIQLLNSEKFVLEIVAHAASNRLFSISSGKFRRRMTQPAAGVCAGGRETIIEDVQLDQEYPPYRDVAAAAGYCAVQSTPLIGKNGAPLGMLSTHFRNPHRPSEQELRRLDLYARCRYRTSAFHRHHA